MSEQQPPQSGIFVDKFYQMDPEHEELLFAGSQLQVGMIVLLEDSMIRADIDRLASLDSRSSKYELDKAREVNQWCEVLRVEVRKRYEHDEMGSAIGEASPVVSFLAKYPDGHVRKRTYDNSYAWIVKKESIPNA